MSKIMLITHTEAKAIEPLLGQHDHWQPTLRSVTTGGLDSHRIAVTKQTIDVSGGRDGPDRNIVLPIKILKQSLIILLTRNLTTAVWASFIIHNLAKN